jgi:anti-anti-sigma regulatory factor
MEVSVVGGEYNVVGIETRKQGEEGVLVELRGEFDRHNLGNLQETLNDVAVLRQSALVDLSGVTFLDAGTSRELAIRSLLYAHRLTLGNPSWEVRASMVTCRFGAWVDFRSDQPPTRAS